MDRRLNGVQAMVDDDAVLNTREACIYLKISRPTFFKFIADGQIKAQKIGKGWKVLKADLDRFVRGEHTAPSPSLSKYPSSKSKPNPS